MIYISFEYDYHEGIMAAKRNPTGKIVKKRTTTR